MPINSFTIEKIFGKLWSLTKPLFEFVTEIVNVLSLSLLSLLLFWKNKQTADFIAIKVRFYCYCKLTLLLLLLLLLLLSFTLFTTLIIICALTPTKVMKFKAPSAALPQFCLHEKLLMKNPKIKIKHWILHNFMSKQGLC